MDLELFFRSQYDILNKIKFLADFMLLDIADGCLLVFNVNDMTDVLLVDFFEI